VTYRRLRDLFSVAERDDGVDKSLNSTDLADRFFVVMIVASQVGEDPGGASDHVCVAGREELDQRQE